MEAVRITIEEMEKKRRVCSVRREGLIPLEGAEEEFCKWDSVIHELKGLCQALQAEGVRRSIAAWQEEIMMEPDAVQIAMKDLQPMG
jgi:hypothetical protein